MGGGVVVLVDFENVQAIDFARLGPTARLAVFAGEGQRKVPIEVAMGLQAMGERARWVKASGAGPNALDFHIAFELGRMVQAGERGPVVVLSKDKGFDPLLTWLSAETGIRASRAPSIECALPSASPAEGAPIAIDPGTAQAICAAASGATRDGDGDGDGACAPAAPPLPAFPSAPTLAPEAHAAAPASQVVSAIVVTVANGASRERPGAASTEAARPAASALVASPAGAPKASTPAAVPARPQPKPAAKAASDAESDAEKAKEILGRSSKIARPRRRTTLATHIKSMLRPRELRDAEVEAIIARLVSKRWIVDNKGAITYNF